MKRFVVIASTRRGVIDPPEALDDVNQELAFVQREADDAKPSEIVVWYHGKPYSAPAGCQLLRGSSRKPQVSAEVTKSVRGAELEMDERNARARRRAGISKRI